MSLEAKDRITYEDHVLPIFQQACLNCHNPDKTKGGLDLSSFASAIKGGSGGAIALPGDTSSTLLAVVRHQAEPKMPPEGEKLDSAAIDLLQQWIEGGLLENSSSSARKPQNKAQGFKLAEAPSGKPEGPPPMPQDLLLEPVVVTNRAPSADALAISPRSPLLAVTGYRQILLYHTVRLELLGILPFPEGQPCSLAFSPSGRHLIAGGGIAGKSGTTVTFDVIFGQRVLEVGREFDSILASDIRPDFKFVATGGPSRLLKIWNTKTGDSVHSVKKHTDWITALDISPDGVLIASGDRGGGIWVWESGSAGEFHVLRAHQAAITSLAFRGDSNVLASASEDGTVRYWEMSNGTEIRKLDAHLGGVTCLAFDTDGSLVSTGRDRAFKRWKPNFQADRTLATNLPTLPTAVASDTANKRSFVALSNGSILVFSSDTGQALGSLNTNPPTLETRITTLQNLLQNDGTNQSDMRRNLAHWEAASINTQRLDAIQKLGTSDLVVSEQKEKYDSAYLAIESLSRRLASKRSEISSFEKILHHPNLSSQFHSEHVATRSAVQSRIARLEHELDSAMRSWIEHRHLLEATLVGHFAMEQSVESLTNSYRAAQGIDPAARRLPSSRQ